jgi:predicted nucleic acid-binding protein
LSTAFVLDSSVIVKWFRQGEILAEQAIALRNAYLNGRISLLAPSLCAYEIANVLRYKEALTVDQIQQAVQSLFDIGIDLIPPTVGLMNRSIEIAVDSKITAYDGAFVALAENLDIEFVTADERLVERLKDFPFIRFLGNIEVDRLGAEA